MARKSILVVDDEKSQREILEMILSGEGYDVTTASSGEAAIKFAKDRRFDLALTDLKMTGMDGIELLQHLLGFDSSIIVILLTAHGSIESAKEALRRGAIEARQAGVAIVLSDFLDPAGYDAGLTALVGRGFQVDLVQILAPDELSPTTFGDLKLIDSETGALQEVTFGRYRMKAYQQTVQSFLTRLREYCQTRGINFFTASSNTSLEELLLKQLRQAEVWG